MANPIVIDYTVKLPPPKGELFEEEKHEVKHALYHGMGELPDVATIMNYISSIHGIGKENIVLHSCVVDTKRLK